MTNIFIFLSAYLIVINIVTLAAFGIDKHAAIKHKSRIREATLLVLASIGGSLGALIGMYGFGHKVRKASFYIGVPLIIILQIILLYILKYAIK